MCVYKTIVQLTSRPLAECRVTVSLCNRWFHSFSSRFYMVELLASGQLGFETRIILFIDWSSTKVRNPSLSGYFIHSWSRRDEFIFSPRELLWNQHKLYVRIWTHLTNSMSLTVRPSTALCMCVYIYIYIYIYIHTHIHTHIKDKFCVFFF